MDVFIFQADVYCVGCGKGIADRLDSEGKRPEGWPDERQYDSDEYPKGPYADGGGEADAPQHCGDCGQFVENALTRDGYAYLLELMQENGEVWDTGNWDLYLAEYGSDICNGEGQTVREALGLGH